LKSIFFPVLIFNAKQFDNSDGHFDSGVGFNGNHPVVKKVCENDLSHSSCSIALDKKNGLFLVKTKNRFVFVA